MKIERMNKGEWGKVRAFFDLSTSEGIIIKGFKIIEGINGLFVSMPSQKGNDDEYYDTVYTPRETRDELTQIALDAYGSQYSETLAPEKESETIKEKELQQSTPKEETKSEEASPAKPFSEDEIPF